MRNAPTYLNMKTLRTYIGILFLLICSTVQGQGWSPCDGGLFYSPKAFFADSISNKLYVSGFGVDVDGMQGNSIASWDGTKWDTLKHGALGAYGEFLIRYRDKLYLQRNDRIYAWDFNTLIWDSIPGGFIDGYLNTAVEFNGDLIIVGEFNHIGSIATHNIVRFDGTNFYPMPNPTTNYYIRAVEIFNNEIYIAGVFNDTIYNGIAKLVGNQWVHLKNGVVGANREIVALKTYRNHLYAGGAFYGTQDGYNPSLIVWDGTNWSNIGGVFYHNWPWGVVYKIHQWNDKLVVCGNFDQAGDISSINVALWNDTNWCSIDTYIDGPVWVSAVFQDHLYVGEHEVLNGDTVNYIGYLNGGYNIGTCGAAVGINEINKVNGLKIYPNPAHSVLYIKDEQNEMGAALVEITNSIRQVVISRQFANEIDVSALLSGCYFISVKTNRREVLRSKFIKE